MCIRDSDYLPKPFDSLELLARVNALLRRSSLASAVNVLRVRDLTLDPVTHAVTRGDRTIDLTRTEFALLEFLMRHPGQPHSRRKIANQVWKTEVSPHTNLVNVFISYLRSKIGDRRGKRMIRTVRGRGYMMDA